MVEAKYAIVRHEKQAGMYEILKDNTFQQDDACGVSDKA